MAVSSVNKNNFQREVLSAQTPVLVDFWAPWCGPCRMFSPVVDQVAEAQAGKAKVVKVNIDEEPELAQRYGVMSIPTLIVFKAGQPAATSVGLKSKAAVEKLLD